MLEIFLSKRRAKLANKFIPLQYRRGRILDIGCGEYPYFLIETEFNEKHGIDRIAKKNTFNDKAKRTIFIKECNITAESLRSFDDEYFDVVTMLAVFEHLEPRDLPRIIKEIKRILKFNGFLVLTTPSPCSDIILQVLSKLRLINCGLYQEHKAVYNAEKISSVLIKGGFSKDNIKFGNFEFFLNIWTLAKK